MIYLYSGTPGSGKSLHQAENIYNRLRAGKPVIANYEINTGAIKHCRGEFLMLDNEQLQPDALREFSRKYFETHRFHEGAIWLFVDEAQILFNAREWQAKGRADWLSFFTQHRKFGYDIFLVAQFDRMIDRQIRSLIEYEVIHRKVSNFGIKGKIFSALALGKLFVAVSIWYPMKEKTGATFFKYHKRYQKLYDSYKDFGSGAAQAPALDPTPKKGREKTGLRIPALPIKAKTHNLEQNKNFVQCRGGFREIEGPEALFLMETRKTLQETSNDSQRPPVLPKPPRFTSSKRSTSRKRISGIRRRIRN